MCVWSNKESRMGDEGQVGKQAAALAATAAATDGSSGIVAIDESAGQAWAVLMLAIESEERKAQRNQARLSL